MKRIKISIIAAISESRALGKNNKLLWHIPGDMKRFKKLTEGHVVIMGRKTFESIGKPLSNRINIVVTHNPAVTNPARSTQDGDMFICHSLEEALEVAKQKEKEEIFIIGGGQIYQQAIKYADKLYLTIVKGKFEADTFFPDYPEFKKEVYKKESRDENYSYTFLELEK